MPGMAATTSCECTVCMWSEFISSTLRMPRLGHDALGHRQLPDVVQQGCDAELLYPHLTEAGGPAQQLGVVADALRYVLREVEARVDQLRERLGDVGSGSMPRGSRKPPQRVEISAGEVGAEQAEPERVRSCRPSSATVTISGSASKPEMLPIQ